MITIEGKAVIITATKVAKVFRDDLLSSSWYGDVTWHTVEWHLKSNNLLVSHRAIALTFMVQIASCDDHAVIDQFSSNVHAAAAETCTEDYRKNVEYAYGHDLHRD